MDHFGIPLSKSNARLSVTSHQAPTIQYRFMLFEDKREVELVWNGKTRDVCTTVLPFQTLEHIDEPRTETKAQQDLAKQRPDLAFAHYEEAWDAAQVALGVVLAASAPAEAAAADPAADHLHDDLEDDSNADETTVVQQLFLPLITR